jgi:hypothetical protein
LLCAIGVGPPHGKLRAAVKLQVSRGGSAQGLDVRGRRAAPRPWEEKLAMLGKVRLTAAPFHGGWAQKGGNCSTA